MEDRQIVSREITQKVWDYIDAREEQLIRDLRQLVRIPSVRGEEEPGMPFGRASFEAVECAAQLYETNGFSVCRRGERGYALAETGAGERALGIFCHCDVVPPDTGVWEQISDPFEPEVKDGYLIGRGVYDNKSAVVGTLYALKALESAGVPLRSRVLVYMGGNEETGMKDIDNYVQDYPVPDVSLVPDCRFPLYRGERSYSRFKLRCVTPFRHILDFSGGSPAGVCGDAQVLLPNAALLREELASALQGSSNPSLSETRQGELILRAQGVSTHPAAPAASINAGHLVAAVLRRCPSLGGSDLAIVEQLYQMTAGIRGEYFNTAGSDPDFGDNHLVHCHIQTKDGCLCLESAAFYSPNYPFARLKENICQRCRQTGWEVVFTRGSKGCVYPADHPVVRRMLQSYRELSRIRNFPEEARVTQTTPFYAVTYARRLKNAFTTGFCMPAIKPPAGFSPGHGYAHQPDECLSIRGFKEGILYLATYIAAIDAELEQLLAES